MRGQSRITKICELRVGFRHSEVAEFTANKVLIRPPRNGVHGTTDSPLLNPQPLNSQPGAYAPRTTTDPLLLFEHVSKWYGSVLALNQVTLELNGGITGLVGAARRAYCLSGARAAGAVGRPAVDRHDESFDADVPRPAAVRDRYGRRARPGDLGRARLLCPVGVLILWQPVDGGVDHDRARGTASLPAARHGNGPKPHRTPRSRCRSCRIASGC